MIPKIDARHRLASYGQPKRFTNRYGQVGLDRSIDLVMDLAAMLDSQGETGRTAVCCIRYGTVAWEPVAVFANRHRHR